MENTCLQYENSLTRQAEESMDIWTKELADMSEELMNDPMAVVRSLNDARKYGRESFTINGLVKPSCLIIDEVGRCVFDKENTCMFFDIIDRRYNKEGPNMMIFTSNKDPDKWGEFFNEDSLLLCALDRIFDDATVFMIKGNSYRGRNCETIALSAGEPSALPKSKN